MLRYIQIHGQAIVPKGLQVVRHPVQVSGQLFRNLYVYIGVQIPPTE